MNEPAEVKDLKEAIKHLEDINLKLNGRILIVIGEKEYEVIKIGHYSVIPDLTLEVQEAKNQGNKEPKHCPLCTKVTCKGVR